MNYDDQFTLYPESLLGYRGGAQLSVTQVEFMGDRMVLRGVTCGAKIKSHIDNKD
mgnify:CR=1 FL=1